MFSSHNYRRRTRGRHRLQSLVLAICWGSGLACGPADPEPDSESNPGIVDGGPMTSAPQTSGSGTTDAGSGGSSTGTGGTGDVGDDDTELTRPFYLSAAPMQYRVDASTIDIVFDVTGFEGRVELVAVHSDFFGIPWAEFGSGQPPPPVWADLMRSIKSDIDAIGAGVYLSVNPLGNPRNTAGANATVEGGVLVVDSGWTSGCLQFDEPQHGLELDVAFAAYTQWMIDLFEPVFLTHVIEMNEYDRYCPDQYPSLIALANTVYDQTKARRPNLVTFPSFTIALMWDIEQDGACEVGDRSCLERALERNREVRRDRFGISAYPAFLQGEWEAMPHDYFSAPGKLTGERTVIAETGWSNRSVVVPYPELEDSCFEVLPSSDQAQIEYLQFLFDEATRLEFDLVTWWSLRDFLPQSVLSSCPCEADGIWCHFYDDLFEEQIHSAWLMWGGMGILDREYREKPSHELWSAWKARPIRP